MPTLLIGLLVGALISLWLARAWQRARGWWIRRRGRAGEVAAEQLLKNRGYRILDTQVRRRAHMLVDDEPLHYDVAADLLVAKRRRTYVVEVKTGKSAPNPRTIATRRQLREYAAIYDVDGLLLADMSASKIHEIRFPTKPTGPRSTNMAAVFLIGSIFGVALTTLLGG